MNHSEISEVRREEILRLAQAECARAIGFDTVNSGELTAQREKALLYAKGEMPDLVMELSGRSKVVDTAVADAIETALPDLMDIFTGGEDVVAFKPVNAQDVAAAEQEQDYLRHVLFNRNGGWLTIYEAFKDALTCKTGVFSWRWDGAFEPQPDYHEGVGLPVLMRCMDEGVCENVVPGAPDEDGLPTVSFEYTPKHSKGRVVVEAVAPEDLAVAADTKTLATATYCVVRQRPRAQDLIAMGYEPELVEALPAWSPAGGVEHSARDMAGEGEAWLGTGVDALRQVEVYRHYIRVYDEDERRFVLYQLVTGGHAQTGVLLDIEEVGRIQLAAITPYINPHRFYGESVADKLLEIQKIKTAMMRVTLDSAFFALNQRHELAEDGMTPDTINDLLNNDPGRPVRVKRAGTITPLGNGALPYNPLAYLEYFETVAEKRTGIVRNAQGLNPETLHDTKGGLEILANNAQKRLRLIARTFAETGYKDFLVNLHATIRENGGSMKDTVRLRDKWVEIDPSTWRQRDDMVIQIGVGAGGREHDLIVSAQVAMIMEKLAMAQNMPDGPLINKQNLYHAAVDQIRKLGERAPERYVCDPSVFQAPDAGAVERAPDPGMMRLQMEAEGAAAEHERKVAEAELKRWQIEQELAERQRQFDEEFAWRRYLDEERLAIARVRAEAGLAGDGVVFGAEGVADRVQVGGEPG